MRALLIFCFLFSGVHHCFSQPTGELVEAIRKQHKAIDIFSETADFQRFHFQDELGLESELVVFRNGRYPVKLFVTQIINTGKEERVFYFDEMGLIYVKVLRITFQRVPRWEEAKSQELGESERDASREKVEKNYFYFKKGTLMKWSSDIPISKKADAYKKMEVRLIEEVEDLLRRLN